MTWTHTLLAGAAIASMTLAGAAADAQSRSKHVVAHRPAALERRVGPVLPPDQRHTQLSHDDVRALCRLWHDRIIRETRLRRPVGLRRPEPFYHLLVPLGISLEVQDTLNYLKARGGPLVRKVPLPAPLSDGLGQ